MSETAPPELDAETPDPGASGNRRPAPFPIVGIGASAGGLTAFGELLENLPGDTGMAYVLVPHLDPTHPSILSDLLSRRANMPVQEVSGDEVVVVPDHVYVLAPNTILSVEDGRLRVTARPGEGAHRRECIDQFLESLAASHRERAIGVILSGTASDGSDGVRAIKAAGGITFAQDDSAQFRDMPRNAIATGAVDIVLPPAEIAHELARIARHPFLAPTQEEAAAPASAGGGDGVDRILRLLSGTTGVDFSQYKQTTVRRRLARRMALRRIESLGAYLKVLEDTPTEVRALHDDILINVTSFFRDPDVFTALQRVVFPQLVRGRLPDDPIRIWVPGCSSGEEVYSLAIALLEFYEQTGSAVPTQIFGTDVSESAIERARAGVYTRAQVAEVSPERLSRYFNRSDRGTFQVSKVVRDLCVYARQDLVRDPPFSRIDLLSCRNVLIYLGQSLQRRVLPLFHYALKPGGFLLLGASESVGPFTRLFTVVDKTQHIYGKGPDAPALRLDTFLHDTTRRPAPDLRSDLTAPPAFDLGREADRVLLAHYVPAAIVVDSLGQIAHVRGETGPYLRPAPGKPSLHMLKMVREDLLLDLERALREAREQGVAVRKERVLLRAEDQERHVTIEVHPLRAPSGPPGLCLVLFRPYVPPREGPPPGGGVGAAPGEDKDREIARLREELTAARSYHQSIVEKYDGVNEDLRSAHEEVLSTNEELQSTNEELETAKEELQATNEELSTLNDELRHRNEELGQLNSDLENLFASVNVPIALVDADLRLRRITPLAELLFNVLPMDVNRRITDFKHNFDADDLDLEKALHDVIETLTPVDREIRDRAGRWYALRIRPYRSVDYRIEGAVIVLTDIHAIKSSLLENERARLFMEAVFRTVPEAILVLDENLDVRTANRAYCRMFDAGPEDTLGKPLMRLGGGQWDIPAVHEIVDGVRFRDDRFDDREVALGNRTLLVSARRVDAGEAVPNGVLLVIDDATESRRAEAELKYSQERLSAMFNQASAGIAQADLTGRIVLANARFAEIMGRSKDAILGVKIEELAHQADRARLNEALGRARGDGRGTVFDARFVRPDETTVWSSADLSFVRDDAGRPEYALLIVQDISPRKRAEEDVRQLTEHLDRRVTERTAELEAVVRELSEFTHTVSHDLRAPLRGMRAMSELLVRDFAGKVLDPTGEGYARRIGAAASRLDTLVVNLLEYSRIGRMDIAMEPVDLGTVVDEVVEHLRDEAGTTGAVIEVEGPIPDVTGSRLLLAQAVENLVGNAMKFVQDGVPPRVHIRAERRDGWVRLWVQDNGIGIAPEHLDRVFGVFERLHSGEYPGTGIGLAIVRRAVERAGGQVGVESEPGRGSRFYLELRPAGANPTDR